MHVDLGKFHYLSLANPASGAHASILASSSVSQGFIEFVFIEANDAPSTSTAAAPGLVRNGSLPVTEQLLKYGSAALDDLTFASGSATLESNGAMSLIALAEFLSANPEKTIVLVGHTDTAGGLEGNLALSLKRAASVRDVLVNDHGVSAERLRAEGIGYLAPRAANDSPEGQERNRRVEAVLEAE
jgi:OOP family OmpA-OmpF porin